MLIILYEIFNVFSFSLDIDRQLNREAKNMSKVILVVAVILFSYMFDLHVCDTCQSVRNTFCTVEDWAPWSPCNATCGGGVQKKQKYICCDKSKYKSLKGCLNACNIPFSWWQANATEYKTCGKCQRGGIFNIKHNSCICPSGYGGSCCDLQTTLPTTIKTSTTTTTIPTTTKTTTIPTTIKTTTIPTTTKTTTIPTTIKTTTIPTTTKTTTPKTTKTSNKPGTKYVATQNKGVITNCSGNPCQHGKCIPMNNQYLCLCSPGYEGHNCDKDIDECANSPCQYGTCKDMVDDFHCECVVFFKGKMCNKLTSWAIAFISLAALSLLMSFCCCYQCICGIKIKLLRQEDASHALTITQYRAGEKRVPRKRKYREIDERLKTLKTRLQNGEPTPVEYGDAASHLLLKKDDERKKVEPLRKKPRTQPTERPKPMERPQRYDDWY
ncbi:Hypothetical predicted protein [Mytilus galloprovincialis]|uniref:EGF-like domain-containing protein n=1 Tax=Mytilus galloprovincialis TaxID=29158 RepID=A0A8B6GI69_MYTGA|nr:Hypothetical predicted protein [Mytilus galloprovincialis]